MDCTGTCKRPCNTYDVSVEEDRQAVRRSRGRRREQIQRQILRFLGCVLVALTVPVYSADDAFSHRKHASLKLRCATCHKAVVTEDRAGFPTIAQCRTCHTDMSERKIPVAIVHELPDFVFFSHASHSAAKVECATCHGDVTRADTVAV